MYHQSKTISYVLQSQMAPKDTKTDKPKVNSINVGPFFSRTEADAGKRNIRSNNCKLLILRKNVTLKKGFGMDLVFFRLAGLHLAPTALMQPLGAALPAFGKPLF